MPRSPNAPKGKPKSVKWPITNANTRDVTQLFAQGLALHQQGQVARAKTLYEQVLAIQPRHFNALHLLGLIAAQTKNPAIAADLIGKALEVDPDYPFAHYNRGNALLDLQRPDEALINYDRAISLKSDYTEAYNNRGVALRDLGRHAEALISYDTAIMLRSDFAEAHNNRGTALKDLKRLHEALASYDKAITLNPDYAEAFNNRGIALKELQRLEEALASYGNALALKPDYADAYNNRGSALLELRRLDDALASYDQALAFKPDYAKAYNNRGSALLELRRLEDALVSYEKALALKPDYAEAYNNRGNALRHLKRIDEAISSYEKAISLKVDYAEAYCNYGNALLALKRLEEALATCDKALSLKPDYAEACNSRGVALSELKRPDDALASYDRAIALKPDYAEAYQNRAHALLERKRLDEALASFEVALSLKPDDDFLFGTYLHTKMMMCNWTSFEENLSRCAKDIAAAREIAPFPMLGLFDSPELHRNAAKTFSTNNYPRSTVLGPFTKRKTTKKIRIGYYSADFHNHATSYLMAELFEEYNSHRFELYGFSFGPDIRDDMRKRVSSSFDHFFDVREKSDRQIAELSRRLGIDIAVDLKGYTLDSRTGIFAEGCAPVQVNYLGYPGTMAAEYIDYLIADKIIIPVDSQVDFTERIVYLPHSYQVNDSRRKISEKNFARRDLGLPQTAFVFCCFNNNYKIIPELFESWTKILKATEDSVLWLLDQNSTATRNLQKKAEDWGVSKDRLVFAHPMPLDDHLARQRQADLFIDTFPYNAHTTASDALWAGLPVLTCMGKSFASRVAASLLNAVELPELVTNSLEEYEAKAIEFARNPSILREIKAKLAKNRTTTPLFDGKLFARHIEAAYEAMFVRSQAGLPPAVIEVQQ